MQIISKELYISTVNLNSNKLEKSNFSYFGRLTL